MTRVGAPDQLAALIRAQLSRSRKSGAQEASGRAPGPNRSNAAADVARTIAQRIQAIPSGDPQREQKALRIYLESVLLAELGPALINDPAFHLMVDQVQSQMEQHPEIARAAQQAARALLAERD